jgi:hypothetical protein
LQSYQTDICMFESTVTPIHICRDGSWIFYVTTLSCESDENVMQDGLCLEEEILSHLPDYCPAPTVLEGGQCRTYAYEVCPPGDDIILVDQTCAQRSMVTQLSTNSYD